MAKSYSMDLRHKILETYLEKEGTNQEIAKRFKISISTVKRIGQRFRETGKVELYMNRSGRRAKLDDKGLTFLEQLVQKEKDLTLNEIRLKLFKRFHTELTIQAIHYILKDMKLNHKKKSYYASQRDREDIKKKS